ncbi:hypothetical protein [Blastococcus sp. PRF04-17]|uniref:hypothetical protein n=1 Tax=Blastococcus sp. PRF04-17 TaxID=2933797 RepID=UPI001FF2CDC3|nr:hypothetical protein [Blastococcus sp. PRF04-17]UOY00856.1 hypothetical protein MVA48_18020 [Blastococcus sp. PRF04-17]
MSSTTTTRPARIAAGLVASGLLLVPLTACTFTSNNVSCTTSSCSVTLSGDGAEAEILGTTLTFGGVQDGRASLGVGGTSVSCAEGESVTAGPLELQCSSVTDDSVELTASLN